MAQEARSEFRAKPRYLIDAVNGNQNRDQGANYGIWLCTRPPINPLPNYEQPGNDEGKKITHHLVIK